MTNDTAIKNYAVWARRELVAEVGKSCLRYGVQPDADPAADIVDGYVLTAQEKRQRADLLRALKAEGYEQLVERAAYTWFNRLLAIRFMEVNDRLPSHVRILSASDGSFAPQALQEAMDLPIDALDAARAAELVRAGDDEALFRLVFLAQCAELAECMPAVFEPLNGELELLLPAGLLRQGSVVEQLVTSIPEGDWREGVEIVGWMYQYYVSERKDEVFASFKKGKKAERDAIAPATQLFTPNWIVQYLTQNSLGRLWMLNRPESSLTERMDYYVQPDVSAELEFKRVVSPEEITVVDPACGSGHILVYAFELLAAMYEEAGYTSRDAARLILEKNLSGMEIDPRAAALASFALTMKACELDSRFLRRRVNPRITVLARVEFTEEELALCPNLAANKSLVDAAAHLDECGSLLQVSAAELDALEQDVLFLAGDPAPPARAGSLFAASAEEKLGRLRAELEPLAARYDVVVANPPYMGAKNMNAWLSGWVKDRFPNSKRDLCTCFIERGFGMLTVFGYSAMVTMESWMFLGSFESMRKGILENHRIAAMVYMNHMVMRIAFNTCATIFANAHSKEPGLYTKVEYQDLNDEGVPFEFPVKRHAPKRKEGVSEALANPDCGWFYRADASKFEAIPGSPIAYWVSDAMVKAFRVFPSLEHFAVPRQGLATSNNARFLRKWWEISQGKSNRNCVSRKEALASRAKWFPIIRGGSYRKWYGVFDEVVDWQDDGKEMKEEVLQKYPYLSTPDFVIKNQGDYFKPAVTWSKISSGEPSFRFAPRGMLFEVAGACVFSDDETLCFTQALCNSTFALQALSFLAPTLNYEVGQIALIPFSDAMRNQTDLICEKVRMLRRESKNDADAFEASWDFKRHPLV